jgi:putative transposase
LDPGIRTFQTFYSPDGICGKLGENVINKIGKIGLRIDKIKSKMTKEISVKKKNRMKKRCFLLRTKIKNIVDDLHWKSALFLCKNFNHVLLPDFKVKSISKIGRRNIKSKSVRNLLSLSHYRFSERLKYKADCYGVNIYKCSEAYTSKICGMCGHIDNNLGSNKTYNCNKCGYTTCRDINGARNVFLRQLGEAGDATPL